MSNRSRRTRTRKHRRTGKQRMKFGKHAKRGHTRKTGRTGSIRKKQLMEKSTKA